MKDLTRGNPLKIICLFSIPVLIGTLFNLLYSLADTRIVGSFLGADALAAVGSISTFGDLLTSLITGFTGGFGILTAQFYGMQKKASVRRNFYISLELGALITLIVVVFSNLFLNGIMSFLNVPEESRGMAGSYIIIIINGMIFTMVYNVLMANLRAIGDAYTPLIFLIISALLNVVLDIAFVGYTAMGVRGASLATILAQAISAAGCIIYMYLRYPQLRMQRGDLIPEQGVIRQMMSNGIAMALMNCLVVIGTLTLQTTINTFGTDIIVAHTAARKISMFYMLPNSVLTTCMANFCGQNFGAGRLDRIKTGLRDSLLISYVWALMVMISSYTIAPFLIRGVTGTDIEVIIQTATLYLKVDTLFYPVVFTICIVRSSLQGMGKRISPVISSSLELVGKVLIAKLLAPQVGYWGIIWTEPVVWCIMIIPLLISIVKLLFPSAKRMEA